MEYEARRYPIDYDALKKGDVITANELEKITEKRRGTAEYRYAVLHLKSDIESTTRQLGNPMTLCSRGDDLVILTDAEVPAYTLQQSIIGIRRILKNYGRVAETVDRSVLTEEQRRVHDASLRIQGAYASSLETTRRTLTLEATKRSVPTLIADKPEIVDKPVE